MNGSTLTLGLVGALAAAGALSRRGSRSTIHDEIERLRKRIEKFRKMIDDVRVRRLTPREAARIMGRPCECAVFNPKRAEELLEKVLAGRSG